MTEINLPTRQTSQVVKNISQAFQTAVRMATLASSPNPTVASHGPNPTIEPYITDLNGVDQASNKRYQDVLYWFLGGLCFCVLLVRILEVGRAWLRHKFAMAQPAARQAYWKENHSNKWPWIKKQIIYAPLWKKRHNREFRLSSAVNVGTLPSRFHTVLLTVYFLSNFAYCAALDYGVENKWAVAAQLRGRSGTLAVANMIPLIILAGRNNLLIPLLKISFDTYNLLHRWMGRMVVLETLVHTLAWAITQHASDGWTSVTSKVANDAFIGWGVVGTVAMILILLSSPSPLRHALYETFLNVHIILAILCAGAVWIHCDMGLLPQVPHCRAIVGLWFGERLFRVVRMLRYNYSRHGCTKATIVALDEGTCRVTLDLPTYVDVQPGSHAYLRFGSIRAWESHPFSIAWVEHKASKLDRDSLQSTEKLDHTPANDLDRTSVSFIIQKQTGMTRALFEAAQHRQGELRMSAVMEGPYGGHHSMISYGHVVLFAGASGITHQISHVHHLMKEYNRGTIATRKLLLVWVIRDPDHLNWVRPWMDIILPATGRKELLNIKVFITRPGRGARNVVSPSNTVEMFHGRPNVRLLLQEEVGHQSGAMCVTVCGPGGLADNVREVVREVQGHTSVDFIEEAFTW